MNTQHLDILIREVAKPPDQLLTYDQLRLKLHEVGHQELVSFIEPEDIMLKGARQKIHRIYIRSKNNSSDGVGWMLNHDVDHCVICNAYFGMLVWPHHCRGCGNIVCGSCSNQEAIILHFGENSNLQRVCVQCCFGQPIVVATGMRINEEFSSAPMLAHYLEAEGSNRTA